MLECKFGCLGPQRGSLPWATQQMTNDGRCFAVLITVKKSIVIVKLILGMCTDLRHIELFGVRFEIPAFEPVRTCSNYSNKLFTFALIDVPRLSPAHP